MNATDLINTVQADLNCFKRIKYRNSDSVLSNCPFHENTGSLHFQIENGFYYCYNPMCGVKGSYDDLAFKLYTKHGVQVPTKFKYKPSFEHINDDIVTAQIRRRVCGDGLHSRRDEVLSEYRGIRHPYMYERGLTDEWIDYWDIGFSKANNAITIPYEKYSTNKKYREFLGVFMRKVNTKQFYIPGGTKYLLFYNAHAKFAKVLFIAESPFDALTIHNYLESPCVATMGQISKAQVQQINDSLALEIVVATDNDVPGHHMYERIKKLVNNTKQVKRMQLPDGIKDVNEWGSGVLNYVAI